MSIRAVIFDVYGTLLDASPPGPDIKESWRRLCQDMLQVAPSITWAEFTTACQQAVARRHALARSRGIPWPEILWPSVVAEVLPEIAALSPEDRDEFIYRQMQIERATLLYPQAAELLLWLAERGCLLGIASNAQNYTFRELLEGLKPYRLDLSLFAPGLCFWSFAHGFSKPDPHVFQILTLRLEQRGIAPGEAIMVGNHLENDLAPAKAFGWQTWELNFSAPPAPGAMRGHWAMLAGHLQQAQLRREDVRLK